MTTIDIFDEIISCLQIQAEKHPRCAVSDEVLQEFFTPSGRPAAAPQPQRVSRPSSQDKPPAPFRNAQSAKHPQSSNPQQPRPIPVQAPMPQPSAPPVDVSNMQWRELWQTAMDCHRCPLCRDRNNVVFGEGNTNADLMFIGEGPGRDEDMQGRPFVGKAGQLLDKMIKAMQFTREEVYIANIIKCRPPNNRNPEPDEAAACLPYLERQIELVKPKAIVILGAVPLQYLFNQRGVTRIHGTWLNYKGIETMVTFHPAYLLRYPADKGKAWSDLQKVMEKFGKSYKKP